MKLIPYVVQPSILCLLYHFLTSKKSNFLKQHICHVSLLFSWELFTIVKEAIKVLFDKSNIVVSYAPLNVC